VDYNSEKGNGLSFMATYGIVDWAAVGGVSGPTRWSGDAPTADIDHVLADPDSPIATYAVLAAFDVTDALAAPRLQLYRGSQLLRENTSWSAGTDAALIGAAAVQVGAFALADGSKDCALLLYLASGSYTAQISGVANTTGVALVEVYEVP